MYYCKDCGQTFEDVETIFIDNGHGEITDYAICCPLCSSKNIEEREDENVRD